MVGRIPSSFIDDLLNRVDIVDLINQRIPLKKAGKDYQACCPFHDEKTPSFTVSRDKQFYHCFGCSAHGSAIGFLMDYDNMSFVEAIEELAHQAGVEVPREGGQAPGPDCRPLYAALQQAAHYYATQLRNHAQAQHAIAYLKQRGVSGEIAREFNIGYAPPGWDNLIKHQGQDAQALKQLRESGMTLESENRCYDRFRDRIMFPIRDHRGRTVGFGGRTLGESDAHGEKSAAGGRMPGATQPKYLNSPETPIFHKGRELYGLHEAHKALRKIERLLVVEGYMDVVALAQFGIRYAVATLGTATTSEHLERIFRTAPKVIFCFDGDRAGRDAGWKALNTTLPLIREGREARFLFLPDGEDPDTLVRREGRDAFEQRIQNATPLSRFLFDKLSEQVDMSSLDGRARLDELAKPLIAKLPQGTFREMMHEHLNKLVGREARHATHQSATANKRQQPRPRRSGLERMTPVRWAIILLLRQPELAQMPDLPTRWEALDKPGVDLLAELLHTIRETPSLASNKGALFERWRGRKEGRYLSKLANTNTELPTHEYATEFKDALMHLQKQLEEQLQDQLLEQYRQGAITEAQYKERLRQQYPGR